jgi:hypothetical protein
LPRCNRRFDEIVAAAVVTHDSGWRIAQASAQSVIIDGPLVGAKGFAGSDATVGRVIAHLVERCLVQPVVALRTIPHAAKRRFASRLRRTSNQTGPAASCNPTPCS